MGAGTSTSGSGGSAVEQLRLLRRELLVGEDAGGVELAELPCGEIAIRNSRFPDGPALLYTRAEIDAFIKGAKDGDFDHMLA